MKPAAFAYYDPTTVDEALGLLADLGDEAKILAGGQSLVPMMNFRPTERQPHGTRDPRGHQWQPVPLHRLPQHRRGDTAGCPEARRPLEGTSPPSICPSPIAMGEVR